MIRPLDFSGIKLTHSILENVKLNNYYDATNYPYLFYGRNINPCILCFVSLNVKFTDNNLSFDYK